MNNGRVARGGLYVHLPFCPYLCPYCDFAKWPLRRSQAERYLKALYAQVEAASEFEASTLFLGGGTPNTYPPGRIAELVRFLRDRFAIPAGAEATIEMNPDAALCEADVFETYAQAGITRISLGVQSFVPDELATLGRRHTAADVASAVAAARAAGLANISLDLMFGVPGQTPNSWKRSLAAALALEPAHVSTYGLTIEDDTPYADWRARRPADFLAEDAEAELYALAIDTLEKAGFEHYEISNFARPGVRCVHNANYWGNGEYLGLGVGAASYLAGRRSLGTRDLETYCSALERGGVVPAETECLQGDERAGEAVMLALRTADGVDLAAFERRYGIDFRRRYWDALAEGQAAGTLVVSPQRVALSRRGRFLANDVCAAFLAPTGGPT